MDTGKLSVTPEKPTNKKWPVFQEIQKAAASGLGYHIYFESIRLDIYQKKGVKDESVLKCDFII